MIKTKTFLCVRNSNSNHTFFRVDYCRLINPNPPPPPPPCSQTLEIRSNTRITIICELNTRVDSKFPFHRIQAVKKELPDSDDAPPTRLNGIALKDILPEVERSELHKLVESNPVMLFMKGTPEEPKCRVNHTVVAALKEKVVEFDSIDVLNDETFC